MKMPDDFKEQVYQSCLRAAKELSDKIKNMSWFGRNHGKPK